MNADRLGLAALVLLSGCSWFTDFKKQPKVDPWETAADTIPSRGNPQYSVPIGGTAVAAFQVSYAPMPATIDSMSSLVNPRAADAQSLENGRKYFQINCAVCHGLSGVGDGPATKYGMPGINLTMDMSKNRTDGYIFGMIRNGRGLMPTYNRIEEMDRWDVVNYVRTLQGRGAAPAQTALVGRPGETGTHLPGATMLGPNRPAPYVHPGDSIGSLRPRGFAAMSGTAATAAPDTSAVTPPPAATTPAGPAPKETRP